MVPSFDKVQHRLQRQICLCKHYCKPKTWADAILLLQACCILSKEGMGMFKEKIES